MSTTSLARVRLARTQAAVETTARDIAVIGYNDMSPAGDLPLPLGLVRSPLHEMGTEALRLPHACIDGAEMTSRTLKPVRLAEDHLPVRARTCSMVSAGRSGRNAIFPWGSMRTPWTAGSGRLL